MPHLGFGVGVAVFAVAAVVVILVAVGAAVHEQQQHGQSYAYAYGSNSNKSETDGWCRHDRPRRLCGRRSCGGSHEGDDDDDDPLLFAMKSESVVGSGRSTAVAAEPPASSSLRLRAPLSLPSTTPAAPHAHAPGNDSATTTTTTTTDKCDKDIKDDKDKETFVKIENELLPAPPPDRRIELLAALKRSRAELDAADRELLAASHRHKDALARQQALRNVLGIDPLSSHDDAPGQPDPPAIQVRPPSPEDPDFATMCALASYPVSDSTPSVPVVPLHLADSIISNDEDSQENHSGFLPENGDRDHLSDSPNMMASVHLSHLASPFMSSHSIDGWSEISYNDAGSTTN